MVWREFADIDHYVDENAPFDPWIEARQAHLMENLKKKIRPLEAKEPTDRPCALVGAGASLRRFGAKLSEYSVIYTTSRAHNMIVGNGFHPTFHVDTDCGYHKADLITVQPDTQYLLSLRLHPRYFDKIPSEQIQAFDHLSVGDTGMKHKYPTFPITCHGGHTALLVAYHQGFRNIDMFGFDFNRENGMTTDMKYTPFNIEFNGHQFETDRNLLIGAIVFYDILKSLPGITVNLYTDGLLRAMMEEKQTRGPNDGNRNRVEENNSD